MKINSLLKPNGKDGENTKNRKRKFHRRNLAKGNPARHCSNKQCKTRNTNVKTPRQRWRRRLSAGGAWRRTSAPARERARAPDHKGVKSSIAPAHRRHVPTPPIRGVRGRHKGRGKFRNPPLTPPSSCSHPPSRIRERCRRSTCCSLRTAASRELDAHRDGSQPPLARTLFAIFATLLCHSLSPRDKQNKSETASLPPVNVPPLADVRNLVDFCCVPPFVLPSKGATLSKFHRDRSEELGHPGKTSSGARMLLPPLPLVTSEGEFPPFYSSNFPSENS